MFINNKSGKDSLRQTSGKEKTKKKCQDWKKVYLDRKRKPTGMVKTSGLFFPALKILAVFCACAFLLFMVSRAIAGPRSDLTLTVNVNDKSTKEAQQASEQIFKAFKDRNKSEVALLTKRIDGHARHDCEEIIGKLNVPPDFSRAVVKSPKIDPALYYVTIPADRNIMVQFVFRLISGRLVFEGLCINQR